MATQYIGRREQSVSKELPFGQLLNIDEGIFLRNTYTPLLYFTLFEKMTRKEGNAEQQVGSK